MRIKLTEEPTLAEWELQEAPADEETVLDYAEMVLTNASYRWKSAPYFQKQRLQQFYSLRA